MTWITRTVFTISLTALPLILYIGMRLAASCVSLWGISRSVARLVGGGVIVWLCLFPLLVWAENSLGITRNRFELVSASAFVDYLVVYPYWVALIAAAELLTPFLLLDVMLASVRRWASRAELWRRRLAAARIVLAASGILFVGATAFFDTSTVRNTFERISIPHLPRELEGLRITLVADLQVDRFTGTGKINQMHRIIDSQKPGLLVFAGDMVTGGTEFNGEALAAMCDRRGSVGSFAVMGDHDYWSDPAFFLNGFQQCGWDFLANQHHVLEYNGKRILVTGLTNVYGQHLNEPRLDSLLSLAPEADLKILLVHQPSQWLVENVARHHYDLLLAGHTHGGQIVLHPFGIPLTPSMQETRYYSGWYRLGAMNIVVTNGIGLTLAPLRYCAPAEVTTITLDHADR